jgi:hypothetical protein
MKWRHGSCPRSKRSTAAIRGRRPRGGSWWSVRPGSGRGPAAPPSVADLPVCPSQPPLFAGAGGMLVGPIDGRVDRDGPLDLAHGVVVDPHVFQQLRPGPIRLPARESLVDGLPGTVPFGQVPPRRPGPQPPQHPIDHLPVIPPRTPAPINTRQERFHPLPRRLSQLSSTRHMINYQTRPSAGPVVASSSRPTARRAAASAAGVGMRLLGDL